MYLCTMKHYTYIQVAKLTGKSVATIRNTIYNLEIKKTLIRGVTHISQDGLETLEVHFSPKTLENSKKKLRVIESYLKHQSCRSVARSCGISKQTVGKIISEWEIDGCITVESSMNYVKKIQNKGIFKKGKLFGYQIMNKGIIYYKSGFTDEFAAIEELLKLKESLR